MSPGTTTVAGVTVQPVIDGYSVSAPSRILVPPPEASQGWETDGRWFGPEGWRLPLGGFLVRTGDRTVLVDAGMGPRHPSNGETGALPRALRAAGVKPEAVTDVVLTHLHIDHVGWVSRDGVPTFPNAVHHWHRADWDHLRSTRAEGVADHGVADALLPAADLLQLIDGDRAEVFPGVTLRLLPGHTPGNCLVEIGHDEERVLLLGDTAHHPVTLVEDGWTDNFDIDRDRARRVRAELADELERTGTPAVGAHSDDCRFGRVVRGGDGRRRWELVD